MSSPNNAVHSVRRSLSQVPEPQELSLLLLDMGQHRANFPQELKNGDRRQILDLLDQRIATKSGLEWRAFAEQSVVASALVYLLKDSTANLAGYVRSRARQHLPHDGELWSFAFEITLNLIHEYDPLPRENGAKRLTLPQYIESLGYRRIDSLLREESELSRDGAWFRRNFFELGQAYYFRYERELDLNRLDFKTAREMYNDHLRAKLERLEAAGKATEYARTRHRPLNERSFSEHIRELGLSLSVKSNEEDLLEEIAAPFSLVRYRQEYLDQRGLVELLRDDWQRVEKARGFLSAEENELVDAYFFEGLSLKSVGERLHLSESGACLAKQALCRRLHRILKNHDFLN